MDQYYFHKNIKIQITEKFNFWSILKKNNHTVCCLYKTYMDCWWYPDNTRLNFRQFEYKWFHDLIFFGLHIQQMTCIFQDIHTENIGKYQAGLLMSDDIKTGRNRGSNY